MPKDVQLSEGVYGQLTEVSWLYHDPDETEQHSGERVFIDTDKDGAPHFMGPDPKAEENARIIFNALTTPID